MQINAPLIFPGQMRWLLTSTSIALSVCAMLSKEQGITALIVCLICDLFIFNKVQ